MIPRTVGVRHLAFTQQISPLKQAKELDVVFSENFCKKKKSKNKNQRDLECFFLREGLANYFNQHPDFTNEN